MPIYRILIVISLDYIDQAFDTLDGSTRHFNSRGDWVRSPRHPPQKLGNYKTIAYVVNKPR
jgi:hypothetical protein